MACHVTCEYDYSATTSLESCWSVVYSKANRIVSSDEDDGDEQDNDEDIGTEVEGGDEGSSGEDNDDNITEVETQSEDEVAIPAAVIREQVSDPANDAHRKFMDRDMIETYGGILAPPVIR